MSVERVEYNGIRYAEVTNVDKPIKDQDGVVVLNSYIGLKKMAWRSPKTIDRWNFNDEKEFESITQQADGDLSSYVDIPREHLIMMAVDQEGDDFEGISMLRPLYGNYFRKNEYLTSEFHRFDSCLMSLKKM